MDIPIGLTLLIIIVLVAFSAFFSGVETALTAASKGRVHNLAKKGVWRARQIEALQSKKEKLIGALLLANNLANILASALATSLLIYFFGKAGVLYATIMMTAIIVIFAEVLPKIYALHHPLRLSLAAAPIVRVLVLVLTPLTYALQLIVSRILRLLRAAPPGEPHTAYEEELRGVIELHARAGSEERQERAMLRSILDLDDVEVSEIMIHRKEVFALDVDLSIKTFLDQAMNAPHTRIPLWRGSPDNIIGILHTRNLLHLSYRKQSPEKDHVKDQVKEVQVKQKGGKQDHVKQKGEKEDQGGKSWSKHDLMALAAKPWFIPENTSLLQQLQSFRRRREHFALVVDEYGALIGIVTLEDILEEIVGDIADEFDRTPSNILPQSDRSVIVAGDVTLRDLNRQFDWDLPDEEAATIAGLIIHEAQTLPESGQIFRFGAFRFSILTREKNQITRVRVTHIEQRNTP